jgi:hypothetical protein
MSIEFIPISGAKYKAVAAIEREAYGLRIGLYDEYKELKTALGRYAASRYSFLIKDDSYKGFCIASLGESVIETQATKALYISDFAVRESSQGLYYGLGMANELLRRANEDDVARIEFHALGSTSYDAMMGSTHTALFLNQYGYSINEVGGSDIYSPDGVRQESLHLISLEKIPVYPL